ncbi:TetR family transcriptional regulator [bacterium]|nr:TetR family transcriptional regulator [bacterium]
MRRTKDEAEKTRQLLLETAESVFGKQGFAATRLSDIAHAAGVTRGAIYHHFGNKMELFVALHKERVDPYFQLVSKIFAMELPPRVKLRNMLTAFLERAISDINFVQRQRLGIFRGIEVEQCEEVYKYMSERGEKFYLTLVELLTAGQEQGDIRKDIKPELAAINVLAYIKGLVSILTMEKDLDMIHDHKEEMIENFLNGF